MPPGDAPTPHGDAPGVRAAAVAPPSEVLPDEAVRSVLERGLADRFEGARALVLIPDHTRTVPLPMLFEILTDLLRDARSLTFMVALGTHPPLSGERLRALVGLGGSASLPARTELVNHGWQEPGTLAQIGTLSTAEVERLAGDRWHESLGGDVPIRVNRAVLEADRVLIVGPTFPHEVVGFSGGAKYLFPGVSGHEMIGATHWLGALAGVRATIGVKDTPVRAMIHAAAARVPTPVDLAALVVDPASGRLNGVFVGDLLGAWSAAADLAAQRQIAWLDRPLRRVLSQAPAMYDELWTAGKAMYKLDPALADGAELILYAPHLAEISRVHGAWIRQIGYHVAPYFLAQWDRFAHVPLGVLAHSTHVRGDGTYRDGVERPRVRVTLASRIPADVCRELNLGYLDPDAIDPADFRGREEEGILHVPKAGETLYRVRGGAGAGA